MHKNARLQKRTLENTTEPNIETLLPSGLLSISSCWLSSIHLFLKVTIRFCFPFTKSTYGFANTSGVFLHTEPDLFILSRRAVSPEIGRK